MCRERVSTYNILYSSISMFCGDKKGKPDLTITTGYALHSSIALVHELNESMNVYIATL